MGLSELAWTQTWSGAPLYVLGTVAQALWLHKSTNFGLGALLAIAAFSTALSVLGGVVIWGRFFAGASIMLWQAINTPALIACVIIYPLVAILIRLGFDE